MSDMVSTLHPLYAMLFFLDISLESALMIVDVEVSANVASCGVFNEFESREAGS